MRRYKWMLPVKQSNLTNVDWIHPKAKYHCFLKIRLCAKSIGKIKIFSQLILILKK